MIKNFFFVCISYALRIFSNVIVIFLIARVLGVEDFLGFLFYLAIATFLAIIMAFGYNSTNPEII